MVNWITEHLAIWTAAQMTKRNGGRRGGNHTNGYNAHGIKKLRELILELAVRGKLVPQDPNDEPAGVLLEKIARKRARLIREGKIKKQKPLPDISEAEKLFNLPEGWKFVRLGDITNRIGSGNTPRGGKSAYVESGIPFLRSQNVWNDRLELNDVAYISEETHLKMSNTVVLANDILLNITGASLGRCTLYPEDFGEANVSQHVTIIRPTDAETKFYLHLCILSPYAQNLIWSRQVGMAREGLSKKVLEMFEIPIPPLAEQHRVVAKVDELMALCDRLELQQTDSNETHQILVETLLATLTRAADQQEFAEAWQRIANRFDTLFTTEQSVDQLKQTILQLAVMGKLVPQDPNDEPASVLLEKNAKNKVRLIKKGKIKKQKPLPEIGEDEKLYELPPGWLWSRIGDASFFSEYGISEKTFEGIDGVPVIKMGDIQDGKVILGRQKLVQKNIEGLPSLYLKNWDLLYNRTNSAELVGKTGIYEGPDSTYTFASYLIRIRCSEDCVHPKYLNLYMNTLLFRTTQIQPYLKQQCGQANVNGTIMKNMIAPIPPIHEQHRIVSKVDELIALCDIMKARLNNAQTTQIQLADAIVEQAVA